MKKLFFAGFICSLLCGSAQASVLDTDIPQLTNSSNMSDEFVKHLANCTPFKEEKTSNFGIQSTYTYQIIGMVDGKCKCAFSNSSQFMTATNNCNFSPEDLERYTDALIRYNKKDKHSLRDIYEDSMVIMGILMDEEICNMDMSDTDYTVELRKHLSDCTPFEEKLDTLNSSVLKKVHGNENGKCHYSYTIEQKPVDFKKLYPNGLPDYLKDIPQKGNSLIYDCLLSTSDINLYNDSLKKSIISMSYDEDDDYNWDPEAPLHQLDDFSKKGICKIKGHLGNIDLEE